MKEALSAVDENSPILWIEQAFTVAAGIIFSLDAFHRNPNEAEFGEHRQLVVDAIAYLKRFEYSKIAIRGVLLLSSLQRSLEDLGSRKRRREDGDESFSPDKRARTFDLASFIQEVSQNLNVSTPTTTPVAQEVENQGEFMWDNIHDLLPPGAGFGGQNLFDDFFSFGV